LIFEDKTIQTIINSARFFTFINVWKVSLLGRTYLEDGTSLPLRYSNSSGLSVEERIKNSLANTELDDPNIRVGGYSNSKIPTLKEWTKGANDRYLS